MIAAATGSGRVAPMEFDPKKHRCYRCKYLTMVGEFACCNYFEVTGKLRTYPKGRNGPHIPGGGPFDPCYAYECRKGRGFDAVPPFPEHPPEPEREKKPDLRVGVKCAWDFEKAKALYMDGMKPKQIAEAVGTDAKTIIRYVQRYGWKIERQNRKAGSGEKA